MLIESGLLWIHICQNNSILTAFMSHVFNAFSMAVGCKIIELFLKSQQRTSESTRCKSCKTLFNETFQEGRGE